MILFYEVENHHANMVKIRSKTLMHEHLDYKNC